MLNARPGPGRGRPARRLVASAPARPGPCWTTARARSADRR